MAFKGEWTNASMPPPGSGSLTAAERRELLKTPRSALCFVGFCLLVGLALEWRGFDRDLREFGRKDRVPEGELQKLEDAAMPIMYLITAAYLGLATLYIAFAILLHKGPVPMTITALVIFISLLVISATIDLKTVYRGVLVKFIVVGALIKAIQSAIAYQKEIDATPLPAPQGADAVADRDPKG